MRAAPPYRASGPFENRGFPATMVDRPGIKWQAGSVIGAAKPLRIGIENAAPGKEAAAADHSTASMQTQ